MSLKATTIDDLRTQVQYYIDCETKKNMADPKDIFLAATISIETLTEIFAASPGCTGVRIYLTKETPYTAGVQEDIWPLIVPVRKESDGSFTDLLTDGDRILESGLMSNFDCRNPPCTSPNEGSKLLPDGLK